MQLRLFLEDEKWVDVENILNYAEENGIAFVWIYGGRGIGKTYGGLKLVSVKEIKFMLMRRTQTQTDLINKPEFSPFKPIARDLNLDITVKPISKYNSAVYKDIEEGGNPIGYTCALSTISNMRGFDASECEILIWDEFIPEAHERPIKNEAMAFYNAYETINRNRELQGKKPLLSVGFANSNDIANPIFISLGLLKICQKMRKKGRRVYVNRERGIMLVDLKDSEISEMKKDTVLYRATKGTDFHDMSVNNEFNNEIGRVKSRSLKQYKPVVVVGELCIYEHKHNDELYATTHISGSPPRYGMGDADRSRFIRKYRWIWDYYLTNDIEFEEYLCEVLLTKAFK